MDTDRIRVRIFTKRDEWRCDCPNCERRKLVTRQAVYPKSGKNIFYFECEWCGEEYWIYGDHATLKENWNRIDD